MLKYLGRSFKLLETFSHGSGKKHTHALRGRYNRTTAESRWVSWFPLHYFFPNVLMLLRRLLKEHCLNELYSRGEDTTDCEPNPVHGVALDIKV